MFDPPLEDWFVWIGVAIVSVAVLGVALALPASAPPDAAALADAVDRVATSPPGASGSHEVRAEAIRLDRRRIGLRGPGGTAHAAVAFGPMTPAFGEGALARVLDGRHPRKAFDSAGALADAAARARNRTASWVPAPSTIEIRRVSWEGVDVLLVG